MLIRPETIPHRPTLHYERVLWARGFARIAGVDEVGRGPLAGPVVAAAVVLGQADAERWSGVFTDSKQMTALQRETAFDALMSAGVASALGSCGSDEIDAIGIASATKLAMARAIEGLEPGPDHLLIDALRLGSVALPQTSIIKGDAISLSIAAASVIAKVTRDRLMAGVFEEQFPGYGFASHKGYGTALHMEALRKNGPCEIHRSSFRPVREAILRTSGTVVPRTGKQHKESNRLNLPAGAGRAGEAAAANILRSLGYEVIRTNFRVREGEIDVVTRLGGQTVFVEVKTRRSSSFGLPEESLSLRRRRRA